MNGLQDLDHKGNYLIKYLTGYVTRWVNLDARSNPDKVLFLFYLSYDEKKLELPA